MPKRGGGRSRPDSTRRIDENPPRPGAGGGSGGDSVTPAATVAWPGRGRGVSSSSAPPSRASSSSVPGHGVDDLSGKMEQSLALVGEEAVSSKVTKFPARPGYGTVGRKCVVRANHFLVEVAVRDLHQYDVSIAPEVISKKTNREIISQLVKTYRQSHLAKRMPAYDGRKSLYTAGPLPFQSKEFVVKLEEKDEAATASASASRTQRDRQFKVTITFASRPDLSHLQEYFKGRQSECPHEVVQALDVVLRASASERYTVVGRSFFSKDLGPKGDPGDGLEYWRGYYQSIRPTQFGLSLNIDVSARGFYEPILVTEFVVKYLNKDLGRSFTDQDRIKLKKVLKGVRVQSTHMGYPKKYKIAGLSEKSVMQTMFTLDDKKIQISVSDYFYQRYNIGLRYKNLPALQMGTDAYIPMELCKILDGQRYTRKLNEKQVTALLRATCQRPPFREKDIRGIVDNNQFFKESLVRQEFGMNVRGELSLVDARVLPAPALKYHETGSESSVNPYMGQWNMINKKMVNGGRVGSWTCVSFSSRLSEDSVFQFCHDLVAMCQSKGILFNPQPVVSIRRRQPNEIEKVLNDIRKESGHPAKLLQLLIIILPDVKGSYGKIKLICETELGIVSQCCQPNQAFASKKQYLENVSLKINVKVGGRNTVLEEAIRRSIPFFRDRTTIIFGADVTHAQPGDDGSPSIAAVVASMDWPEVSKYRALVSALPGRVEIISDLYTKSVNEQGVVVHGGMIRELLKAFRKSTNLKPDRIIFYRDGVGEGQFSEVVYHEVDAIHKACSSLEEGYLPRVTFVLVQKRHHTRFFPQNHGDRNSTDKSGNVLPGTVVDTKICHPTEFDFYLNSHAGIQGTSRPAHYHVLYDDNEFSADALQTLTNNLCYTFARCTRSVSVVPPAYYAHLAAFRARYYMEHDSSDVGSSGSRGTRDVSVTVARTLPSVKENVKDVMFYC